MERDGNGSAAMVDGNSDARAHAQDSIPEVTRKLLAGDKPHQFLTLDALRGVAALAVIVYHGRFLFKPIAFPSGYLAVDFFFMLSGFVLTHAYERRLDGGWSTVAYLRTRLIRLYPLYLLGLLLGLVYHVGLSLARHQPVLDTRLLSAVALGLLILPGFSRHAPPGTASFPLNYPSWSIFFELLVNIIQALFLRRRSTRFLLALAAASLATMAWYGHRNGSINVGVNVDDNRLCVVRVLFSYTVGMLLYRLWRSGRIRVGLPPVVSALVLMAALALPMAHAGWSPVQELLLVTGLFPALILLAAKGEPRPRWRPLFRLLGQLSYAVYVLHGPLLSAASEMLVSLGHGMPASLAPYDGLLFLALLIPLALLADRLYDVPVRKRLRAHLQPAKAVTG